MLPAYEYFAQGIEHHSDVSTFKISNFHLPPSPWLGDSVLPALERHCNNFEFEENCELSFAAILCSPPTGFVLTFTITQ